MSRSLLILALLASGTGCSSTRSILSPIVVTAPKLSFRQLHRGDAWQWTAVAVTYPSESLTPAPCAASPVHAVEPVTFFEEDECHAPLSPSGPVSALPTIVHLEDATGPQSIDLPEPSISPVTSEVVPSIQTGIAVMHPSGFSTPAPCEPSPIFPVDLVSLFDVDESPAALSPSGPAPAPPARAHLEEGTSPPSVPSVASAPLETTPVIQMPSTSTFPATPDRVESLPPMEAHWKPTARIAPLSPAETSTAICCDQDETTPPEVHQALPQAVLVPSDISDLLAENRNQRQLIEALQRELTRERSADDVALEELEAAVEDLLVLTQNTPGETPSNSRK
jgi:hypothetical protein